MFSVNKSRYITKAKTPRYGRVVDEASSQYYIHIGLESTKDPKNNVQKLPQIMQTVFDVFHETEET